MNKTCGNCACIEYHLNHVTCILDGSFITGLGTCGKWEPNNDIELGMLRKQNAELSKKLGQLESQVAEYRQVMEEIVDISPPLCKYVQQLESAIANAIVVIEHLGEVGDEYCIENYVKTEINKLKSVLEGRGC